MFRNLSRLAALLSVCVDAWSKQKGMSRETDIAPFIITANTHVKQPISNRDAASPHNALGLIETSNRGSVCISPFIRLEDPEKEIPVNAIRYGPRDTTGFHVDTLA